MSKVPHIVWIASWYPHEGEPYAGDFIRRHAQAVSALIPITVFSCFPHPSETKTLSITSGQLTEITCYFRQLSTGIPRLDRVIEWGRWYQELKKKLAVYIARHGKPDLLHCHIILNGGWLGLWAKRKWKIPFIVTEHWSGFMRGAEKGYDLYNSWSKRKFHEVVKEAALVTGVSDALIHELKKIEPAANYVKIANVVDQRIFNYQLPEPIVDAPTFIHISTLTGQKNFAAILNAIAICKLQCADILLKVAGPKNAHFAAMAQKLGLEQNVSWLSEMPQEALVQHIRRSKALILFSRYESFGCVVIEANAAGIPVIVSDIAPMRELVADGFNGVIAREGDPGALATAILGFIGNLQKFNHTAIAAATLAKFSYPVIGRQITRLYAGISGL